MKLVYIFLSLIIANTAFATIESIGRGQFPYRPLHAALWDFQYAADNWDTNSWYKSQGYCMAQFMYYDHYSSSELPKYKVMMKPVFIHSFPEEFGSTQINELSDGVLKIESDWDDFEQFVRLHPEMGWESPIIHTPTFSVDVSGYDKTTKGGRLEALVKAKLAIISVHYNLAKYRELFRLTVNVKGLPEDQSEFVHDKFTQVYEKTNFPYSRISEIVQNYYSELISSEFCTDVAEETQSFL